MAKANDRRFVLLASAGFDAEAVERMNSRQKNLLGISAYVLCGARHLLRSQPALWLELPPASGSRRRPSSSRGGKSTAGT